MLRWFFLFFIATLPFQMAISPIPGVDAHVSRFLSIAIGITWFIVSVRKGTLVIPKPASLFSLILFFVIAVISLVFAANPWWGFRKIAFLLSFLPIFFVAFALFQERRFREAFSKVLVVGASVAAVIALTEAISPFVVGLQSVLNVWRMVFLPFFLGATFSDVVLEYPSLLVNIGGQTILRGSAFFPDPHIAAFFFGMSVPFALALSVSTSGSKRMWFGIAALLLVLADIATFSRGGLVALLLTGTGFLLVMMPHIVRRFGGAVIIGMSVFAIVLVFPNPFSARLFSIASDTDASNSGRIAIWREAVAIIKDHPLLGVGLGNYSLAIKPSATYREPRYAHNLFLDTAAEIGLPVALFLTIALMLLVARSFRAPDVFIRAGGVSLSIFLLHSFFETPVYSVHILPLFFSLVAMLL